MKEHPRPISRFAAPIKGAAQRFAYVGLIVATFGLLLVGKADVVLMERFRSQISDAFAPIMDVLSRPAASVSHAVDNVRELAAIREENARLRERNARLLQWQATARRLDAENRAFRTLLNVVPEAEESFVTARLIADSGGAFARSLLLNAGSRDGVKKGQAVITGEGLIGRIADVGARSSRLLLITDLNSHIPVAVESTRTRGILAGNNTELPRLIHLPPGSQVTPGERVVTSGHGGAFPPGLPVGVVAAVSEAGIAVRPFVETDHLEYVRIVDYGLKGILQSIDGKDGGELK